MRAVEESQHVYADHAAPVVQRGVGHRPEQHHAGVVDEDVEAAELLLDPADELACLTLVGHVQLERDGPAAVAGR